MMAPPLSISPNEHEPRPVFLADKFQDVFRRVLSGDKVDFYREDANLSRMFEIIATTLMADTPGREFMWYDGVVGLIARIRKSQQVEFTGEMWVGDRRRQWKEDFRAMVTDKRTTKQGIWITLWIGQDRVEGELSILL